MYRMLGVLIIILISLSLLNDIAKAGDNLNKDDVYYIEVLQTEDYLQFLERAAEHCNTEVERLEIPKTVFGKPNNQGYEVNGFKQTITIKAIEGKKNCNIIHIKNAKGMYQIIITE